MKTRRIHTPLLAIILAGMLFSMMPLNTAIASPGDEPTPVQAVLDHLSEILKHLEGELSALEAPRAERLEQGLEELIELIENLLDEFDRPHEDGDAIALKARILRLDLMLHRLIAVLEELLEVPSQNHPGAREAIGNLRHWANEAIAGLTEEMNPQAAERVEQAIHETVRDLARRIAELAERTQPKAPEYPKLVRLLKGLEVLVERLDSFILRHFPRIPKAPR